MAKPRAKSQKPRALSHYDRAGRARMVDVSEKHPTKRTARASAFVAMSSKVLKALPANPKGDPLEVARFAGISAAKRTAELIPMCHPLPLSHIDVRTKVQGRNRRLKGMRVALTFNSQEFPLNQRKRR